VRVIHLAVRPLSDLPDEEQVSPRTPVARSRPATDVWDSWGWPAVTGHDWHGNGLIVVDSLINV